MRTLFFAAATLTMIGALPVRADTADEGAAKTVRSFFAMADQLNYDGIKHLFVASPTILDDFPPHHWAGPKAYDVWSSAVKTQDFSDAKTTLPATLKVTVTGDHAYAVVPADVAFKSKGQPHDLTGTGTFALDHTAKGWQIAAFAWSDGTLR